MLLLGAARQRTAPAWDDVRRALLAVQGTPGARSVVVHNIAPCWLGGELATLRTETVKRGRLRIDSLGRGRDFGLFLAHFRFHARRCASCVHRVECDGFWRWESPPQESP
jgi:hypothetical protein